MNHLLAKYTEEELKAELARRQRNIILKEDKDLINKFQELVKKLSTRILNENNQVPLSTEIKQDIDCWCTTITNELNALEKRRY